MNTLLTIEQQEELVKQKLAVKKYDDDKGLVTYKYHRRVMFENLWAKHPEVLECRGHVYALETGKLVQAAPRKSFNYTENGHWSNLPLDTPVRYMKKYNGFMACATLHKGQQVISTTGTTNSAYVGMAEESIFKNLESELDQQYTDLFEIIHQDDPHIVDEGHPRAVYLGYRDKFTGEYHPYEYQNGTIQTLLNLSKTDKGEGFMAWLPTEVGFLNPAKFKTDYYVGKKKLMRMSADNCRTMFSNPEKILDKLPTMWQDAVFKIQNHHTLSEWQNLSDQQRRVFLEKLE